MEHHSASVDITEWTEVPAAGARWFAVWGLDPFGECMCPKGRITQEVRDVRVTNVGTCDNIGKHPLWVKMPSAAGGVGGEVFGFMRGLTDAVPLEEFSAMWPSLLVLGGQPAVCVPGDWWVLDVDGPAAWRGLVRLFKAGSLSFDRVAAVARTNRGWHVWVHVEGGASWRSASAQKVLDALLKSIGAPLGLEVKSGGGYVVVPGGFGSQRTWVDVMAFANAVANHSRMAYGWGSQWSAPVGPVGLVAVGSGPVHVKAPDADGPTYTDEDFGLPAGTLGRGILDSRMSVLRLRCADLAEMTEGGRNNTLNRVAFLEGTSAIEAGAEVGEVVGILMSAGMRSGLGESECAGTVRSALGGLL